MDALFAILPGVNGPNGPSGNSQTVAGDDAFASLLAGFGVSQTPVQPVAPINGQAQPRSQGQSGSQGQQSDGLLANLVNSSALSASLTTGHAGSEALAPSSPGVATQPGAATLPTEEGPQPGGPPAILPTTQGPQPGVPQTGLPTERGPQPGSPSAILPTERGPQPGSPPAILPTTQGPQPFVPPAVLPTTQGPQPGSPPAILPTTQGPQPVDPPAILPTEQGPQPANGGSNLGAQPSQTSLISAPVSDSVIETTPKAQIAGNGSASAEVTPSIVAKMPAAGAQEAALSESKVNAKPSETEAMAVAKVTGSDSSVARQGTDNASASTPGTYVTPPNSTTSATQSAGLSDAETSAVLPLQGEAGVQARRAADTPTIVSALTGQNKSTAKSNASASLPAQAISSTASSSSAQSSPPPAAPTIVDLLAATQPLDPLAQRPAGERGLTSPVMADAQSSGEAEAEALELGNARTAEAARSAERPGTAAGTARFTPANAGALAAQIAARFSNGERKFEIRMDPPELGRVEVKLSVSNDNRVHAILSAERPETLQDMRQHMRELERALNEAGLDLDENGLSFELSQGERGDEESTQPGFAGANFTDLNFAEDTSGDISAAAPPIELYGFNLARAGGVDVRL